LYKLLIFNKSFFPFSRGVFKGQSTLGERGSAGRQEFARPSIKRGRIGKLDLKGVGRSEGKYFSPFIILKRTS